MKGGIRRISALARKEMLHILHDARSLIIIFIMPVFMLIMFGYALNLEIQRIDLAVTDHAQNAASERLIGHFRGSPLFYLLPAGHRDGNYQQLFSERKARAVLVIPENFGNRADAPQLLIDAADPNAATLIRNYIEAILREQAAPPARVAVSQALWFNPELKSAYFFVPGLLAMLLIMICALLTSITITREKESGSMEQILVSPVRPQEVIIGKVLPYIGLSFLIGLVIIAIGRLLFGVPFIGSQSLLLLLSLVYITTSLSLGLMISTVAATQQIAMMLALVITLLPTILLSGFIFPLASMPEILQWVSTIVPARYYLQIARGVMLKGNTLSQLMLPAGVLVLMTFVMLMVARRRFQATLEN